MFSISATSFQQELVSLRRPSLLCSHNCMSSSTYAEYAARIHHTKRKTQSGLLWSMVTPCPSNTNHQCFPQDQFAPCMLEKTSRNNLQCEIYWLEFQNLVKHCGYLDLRTQRRQKTYAQESIRHAQEFERTRTRMWYFLCTNPATAAHTHLHTHTHTHTHIRNAHGW